MYQLVLLKKFRCLEKRANTITRRVKSRNFPVFEFFFFKKIELLLFFVIESFTKRSERWLILLTSCWTRLELCDKKQMHSWSVRLDWSTCLRQGDTAKQPLFMPRITLGRTSKFISPPWYQGGGGWVGWNSSPEFLICCSISKRFCRKWKAFDFLNKKRYILWMVAVLEACDVTNNGCHLGFCQELEIGLKSG